MIRMKKNLIVVEAIANNDTLKNKNVETDQIRTVGRTGGEPNNEENRDARQQSQIDQ